MTDSKTSAYGDGTGGEKPLPPAVDEHGNHGLRKNQLGVSAIVFYIIAAASPLTGVVAIVPLMIGLGNGVGAPGAFIIAAGILLLFAVGYLAMSRHVLNAGALYAYVTLGLGKIVGLGTASLTVFAYSCIQFSLYGGFGYYLSELIETTSGIHVPWWLLALLAMAACLGLGVRGVHAGAIVLGVSICLELTMLVLLSGGILFGSSPDATPVSDFSFEPFNPATILAAGFGVAVMFAHTTFIGFEGSAIYSEEAKNPKRTIPRATYTAVILMAVVYAGSSFLIVNTLGVGKAQAIALEQSGNLLFFVSNSALGAWATNVFSVLICTAIFAAIVTFHNNIARYLYSIGRQGLVWRKLGYTREVKQTPYVASIIQTISAVLVVGAFAVAGLDPYTTLFTWLAGIGTIGIIGAQVVAAIAIFVFFQKTKVDTRLWNTRIAPFLAILGLGALLLVAIGSVDILLGAQGALEVILMGSIVVFAALGVIYALWLKYKSPEKYKQMGVALVEDKVG